MKTYDTARTGAVLRARTLRRDSTVAEQRLWSALRQALPQYRWRRQMPIGPYFVDFACFAERLVIELDGGQHALAAGYDTTRTSFIAARGYRVLRLWNNEVGENLDGVLQAIAAQLPSSPSRGCAAHPSPTGRGNEARSAGRVKS